MSTERQEQAYEANLQLQHEIQACGINAICCNSCDAVNFHKTTNINEKETLIICVGCEELINPNDCTDLFY